MAASLSLIKANPLLPAEDYGSLRKQGFKGIEQLGSDIWTDYNNSDPGITMLEAVCYAITDLAYRNGFEIKDLLAPEKPDADTWKQIFYTARQILHNNPLTLDDYRKIIIDVPGVRNAWVQPSKDYEVPVWIDYNAVQVKQDNDCSCPEPENKTCFGQLGLNPVDETKYRTEWDEKKKSILEALAKINEPTEELDTQIKQLKHAIFNGDNSDATRAKLKDLVRQRDEYEDKIGAQRNDLVAQLKIVSSTAYPSKIVEFEGLYNVMVEYEEDILEEGQREAARQQVIERLSPHRNLCEDFLSVNAVEYEDFGIGAAIVLEEYADADAAVAQVFFTIYDYFTPAIPFYTIQQMLDKGYLVDEIFEGPALKHGFIDQADLDRTALFRDIHLSDLIGRIAGIPGIKAVTYLHLPFLGFNKETPRYYFNQWIKFLQDEQRIARIQPSLSQVLCCKEREFISYNTGAAADRKPDRMLKLFRDLKAAGRKYKLQNAQNDFLVPAGEYMELQDYYPVTYSLPECYGVSDRAGLPADADAKRKIQALQLGGYLLFFEQILADHLVQLDHLRDLFSFDDTVKHTYFTRALTEIQNLQSLLIDHAGRGQDHFDLILKDFTNVLENITEAPTLFHKRRNIFLDHLLARFSEDLSEYEALSRWLTPYKVDERMIRDKIAMLKNGEYYRISTDRGKGYDYARSDYWDTSNVSGTERRISRLLGFADIKRRSLAPVSVVTEAVMVTDPKTNTPVRKTDKAGNNLNVVKLLDPDDQQTVLFTSVEVKDGCCTEELISDILEHADDRRYFKFHDELKQRSRKSAGLVGTFWFELYDDTDPETAVLLGTSASFDKKDNREHAFKQLEKLMTLINNNEGLHLVEHILLRPKFDEMLDEVDQEIKVSFLDVCLDECDRGKGLNEGTQIPGYRIKTHRIPASKCYDKMPWVLEYFRFNTTSKQYDLSILFQQTFPDDTPALPLKFRRYEDLSKRISDIHEFGSERVNYEIVSNQKQDPGALKYSFILHGSSGTVLAQSPFIFNKKTGNAPVTDDIETEISNLMSYCSFELDLYCAANPCDNNEDPYSFRTTVVLPCWPKRFRDVTFRNLVEKTIQAESPAHTQPRIVWIGIAEMQRFEQAYRDWLLEMAQTEMPGYDKVNPLVEVLNTLQPCGTCKDDCSGESAPQPAPAPPPPPEVKSVDNKVK